VFAAATILAPSPAAIAATARAEQALVRAAAEAAIEASRLASSALPPVPPRAPRASLGDGAPRAGLLRLTTTARPADLPRPRLEAPAIRYGGDALRYLRTEAHAGIVAAVADGTVNGINPRDVARGLRDVVGLGRTQAVWVSNLRRELETGDFAGALERKLLKGPIRQTVAARARSGKPLTAREIDRVVAGYAEKWVNWHAETIGRTLSLDLLRTGTVARARAARDAGIYGDRRITKRWVTRVDGRERDAHRELNGATIDLDARWLDAGVLRDVPGGYNCRCAVVIRFET
jgi:hypothetical protein